MAINLLSFGLRQLRLMQSYPGDGDGGGQIDILGPESPTALASQGKGRHNNLISRSGPQLQGCASRSRIRLGGL
jgi:hypothetical protein